MFLFLLGSFFIVITQIVGFRVTVPKLSSLNIAAIEPTYCLNIRWRANKLIFSSVLFR